MLEKQRSLVIVLSLTLLSVSACGGSTRGSSFCDIYTPVYTVDEDTEQTKDQVDENNVVYDEDCDG